MTDTTSRKELLRQIEDNVGESDWDTFDILAQALEMMDDAMLEQFFLKYHNWELDD